MLARLGHDTDTVPLENLSGRPDAKVWDAAQRAQRLLITQDADFSNLSRFTPGTHHGLVIVRLRDPGRGALTQRIEEIFAAEEVESWEGCLVIATDRKIRVRRPRG